MECLFGITGKDFTLLVADTNSARSIVVMKSTEDKSRDLNDSTVMLYSGEPGDTVNFAEYIQRNIKLYSIRNGIELSPKAVATFTRRELADSLRSRHPYSVNLIIGGYDRKAEKSELFWIDYLGAMASLPFAAQGYGAYFCTSLMDRYYRPDMDLEEAKKIMRMCVEELKTRFIVHMPKFSAKLVNKDGVTEIEL
ncbi:nucleophile aminohydrolase [Radiomyces spectabilis]|uniref:nucleophile aminohydrolase n=1 Tax=Radiomyces spectabilis TaxID=64574 RepID=UPI0022207552|nr:nucleophile aminohydrolase [Radiomyces spectabilis]KAI8393684.1 nucleophile aminohydrolase [Radiomyces spectabilis]